MCSRFLNPMAALLDRGFVGHASACHPSASSDCVFSASRAVRLLLIATLLTAAIASAAQPPVLRVCAEPDNLPYSNQRGEGFENRIAELTARDLGMKLEYVWWTQRRGFVRSSLNEGLCDALMEMPAASDLVSVTRPYYRSTYVWITRKDRGAPVAGFDDPRLKQWKIGIHRTGGDVAPPGVALGRRGLAANLEQYSLFGEYGAANPPARLIEAVHDGSVDAAIAWGPLAGYFASSDLQVTPVSPAEFDGVPFTFAVAMGVRKGDTELRAKLDAVITRRCAEIRNILNQYRVPLVGSQEESCESQPLSRVSPR